MQIESETAQSPATDLTQQPSLSRTCTVEYSASRTNRRYLKKAEQCVSAVPDVRALEDSNCFWEELSKRKGNLRATGGKRLGTLRTLRHFSVSSPQTTGKLHKLIDLRHRLSFPIKFFGFSKHPHLANVSDTFCLTVENFKNFL